MWVELGKGGGAHEGGRSSCYSFQVSAIAVMTTYQKPLKREPVLFDSFLGHVMLSIKKRGNETGSRYGMQLHKRYIL